MTNLYLSPVALNNIRAQTSDKVQRPVQVSDSDGKSFEHALQIAKAEKSKNNHSQSAALTSREMEAYSDFGENLSRRKQERLNVDHASFPGCVNSVELAQQATTLCQVQSVHAFDRGQCCEDPNAMARPKDLIEWLDTAQNKEHEGSWTFEFQTETDETFEIQLCCHKSGQWDASLSLHTSVAEQQALVEALQHRGVSLSYRELS